MTTYSRFPRDPDAIRALAAELEPPDLEPRFQNPFWLIATLDIAYNLGLVFGRPLFPRYRYHSIVHPFAEYAGWLWSRGRRLFTARAAIAEKARLQQAPGLLFSGAAATGDRLSDPRAFAVSRRPRGGARDRRLVRPQRQPRKLVFIAHPLDNGLIAWDRVIARLAREFGVADRVLSLPRRHAPRTAAQRRRGRDDQQHDRDHGAVCRGSGKGAGQCRFRCSGADLPGSRSIAFWKSPPRARPGADGRLPARAGRHDAGQGRLLRAAPRRPALLPDLSIGWKTGPIRCRRLTPADFAARPPRLAARTVVVAGVSNGLGWRWRGPMPVPGSGSSWSAPMRRPGTGRRRLPASRRSRRNLLRGGSDRRYGPRFSGSDRPPGADRRSAGPGRCGGR